MCRSKVKAEIKSMELGAWGMEKHGAWGRENGAWGMEHGSWVMELDLRRTM